MSDVVGSTVQVYTMSRQSRNKGAINMILNGINNIGELPEIVSAYVQTMAEDGLDVLYIRKDAVGEHDKYTVASSSFGGAVLDFYSAFIERETGECLDTPNTFTLDDTDTYSIMLESQRVNKPVLDTDKEDREAFLKGLAGINEKQTA